MKEHDRLLLARRLERAARPPRQFKLPALIELVLSGRWFPPVRSRRR
jgi:hypothetical protein